MCQLWLANQFLEKRPVVNHCLAEIFCAGLPPCLTERYFVCRPVILKNQRMVHGDICRPLFKVTYRITTCGHHIA